ncbi:Tetratricopeptide repeat-containing protein [Parelusimicrobium proximum]|uniref:tetratricopeptide repeat protein n=1 Tax=Parelusimicrobium proximum TaxID=3228953 RepID=UPI003D1683D9
MKKNVLIFSIFLCTLLLAACEGERTAYSDEKTSAQIEEVIIEAFTKWEHRFDKMNPEAKTKAGEKFVKECKALAEQNRDNLQAYGCLAEVYELYPSEEKNIKKKLEYVLKLTPKTAEDYMAMGSVKKYMGLYTEAKEYFEKAVSIKPESHFLNERAAYINFITKNDGGAGWLEYMNKAIEQSPKTAYYYMRRGILLDEEKKYEDALKDFRRAKELDNNMFSAFIMERAALANLGRYEQAIFLCRDKFFSFEEANKCVIYFRLLQKKSKG